MTATINAKETNTVWQFQEMVYNMILDNLEKDVSLIDLLGTKKLLVYRIEYNRGICNEVTIKSDKCEHLLARMVDFFTGPSDNEPLAAVVHLTLRQRQDAHPNQPKHFYQTEKEENISLDDIVFERRLLELGLDRTEYVYVRLGVVPEEPTSPPHEDQRSNKRNAAAVKAKDEQSPEREPIRIQQTLLGYYFKADLDKLHLITVPAWDFGKQWIGNCVDHYEDHAFDVDDHYLPPFAGAKNPAELHELVKVYLQGRTNKMELGRPFLPYFSREVFDPTDYNLGVPGESADGVFHFVSHVDLKYTKRDKAQLFPFDLQCEINSGDGAGEISRVLKQALKNRSTSADVGASERMALSKLFSRFVGKWKFVLWVLPQGDGKIFRFPTGRVGGRESLDEFLKQETVESGQKHARALYIEAHIVGVGDEDEDAIRGTVQSEDDEDQDEEGDGSGEAMDGEDEDEGGGADVGRDGVGLADAADGEGRQLRRSIRNSGAGRRYSRVRDDADHEQDNSEPNTMKQKAIKRRRERKIANQTGGK